MKLGKITLLVPVEDEWELEKMRHMIRRLYSEGVFLMRAGKAVLHFDPRGILSEIGLEAVKWKVDRPSLPLYSARGEFMIEAILETTHSNPQPRTSDTTGGYSSDGPTPKTTQFP